MLIKFRTIDAPEANGRTPEIGEARWILSFPLENGDDYLEVELGKRGRDAIIAMLSQESINQLTETPVNPSPQNSEP